MTEHTQSELDLAYKQGAVATHVAYIDYAKQHGIDATWIYDYLRESVRSHVAKLREARRDD